jgi:hypothetical protein
MACGRVTRRRALGLGAAGVTAIGISPGPLSGVGRAMAQASPDTVVYVSNAGDPSIGILSMNRANGDLDLIEKVAIPGAE